MKIRFFVLYFVLGFSAAAQGAERLTLESAVELALAHNRDLKQATLEVSKAQSQVEAAETRRLPNFNLYVLGAQQLTPIAFTFEKGAFGTFEQTGPIPAEDTEISTPLRPTAFVVGKVSQPLTPLLRLKRNIEGLKTGVDAAREDSRAERQTVVYDVKRLYYDLQQEQALQRSIRETLKLYREIERLTTQYVAQEVALQSDLLDIQARIAEAEANELSIQNRMDSGKEQLNRLLGRDVLRAFDIEPSTAAAELDLDVEEARRRALAWRPEIRKAQLRREQAEWDVKAKKAESIPDLSLEFNSIALLNFSRFLPTNMQSVGVSMSWEPFDWGRKKAELEEKRYVVDQAANAESDAKSAIVLDVNSRFRQLQQNRMELRTAQLKQATSVEALRVTKNKFAADAVLLKDVLQAQASVEEDASRYQRALLAFWDARADFERAVGEDR